MAGCPSYAELALLLEEQTGDGARALLETHVETCAACQEGIEFLLVAAAVPCLPARPTGGDELEPDEVFLQQLQALPLPQPEDFPAGPTSDSSGRVTSSPYTGSG